MDAVETNNVIVIVACVLLSGCVFREAKPDKPEGVYQVIVNPSAGTKEIVLRQLKYIGLPSAEGWKGWESRSYSLIVPLGDLVHVVNPVVKGMDSDEAIGYINFDKAAKTIDIHVSEVVLDQPPGWWNDVNAHGIGALKVSEVREASFNGKYSVENPDAFK
jgi:hypothetical protein